METNIKSKFENDGYIVLKKVFEPKELEDVIALTDEIIDWSEKYLEDPFQEYFMRHRSDQGVLYDLYCRHPEFRRLVDKKELIEPLKEIMGENFFLYENSLIYKPKGKYNEVPWHQDFMNRTKEPSKFIVWIALDDVKISNGALKFIPESHKNGFGSYHKVRGETHHTRLDLSGVDVSKYKYGEMKKGDVLIFHHLVIHGSDSVDVSEPRRAYRFAAQGIKQVFTPRSVPIMLSGGNPEAFVTAGYNKKYKKSGLVSKAANKLGRYLMSIK